MNPFLAVERRLLSLEERVDCLLATIDPAESTPDLMTVRARLDALTDATLFDLSAPLPPGSIAGPTESQEGSEA